MRQTFDGHNQAIDFAQIESRKQNKKMWLYLIRENGVQYAVCDTVGAQTIVGKLMGEYGQDPVIKPIQPPPTPTATLPEHPRIEEPIEELVPETVTTETPPQQVEIKSEEPKEEVLHEEKQPTEKPKRTRKKKGE